MCRCELRVCSDGGVVRGFGTGHVHTFDEADALVVVQWRCSHLFADACADSLCVRYDCAVSIAAFTQGGVQ